MLISEVSSDLLDIESITLLESILWIEFYLQLQFIIETGSTSLSLREPAKSWADHLKQTKVIINPSPVLIPLSGSIAESNLVINKKTLFKNQSQFHNWKDFSVTRKQFLH